MPQTLSGSPEAADWSAAPHYPLILDMLEWLSVGPRTYAEVMDAWRTSCPRLTVWEDAVDAGWVVRRAGNVGGVVELTPSGRSLLVRERP